MKLLTSQSKQLYISLTGYSMACVSPYVSNTLMFTKTSLSLRLAFPRLTVSAYKALQKNYRTLEYFRIQKRHVLSNEQIATAINAT